MPGHARIGYILKAFPVVSETFILNEVRAMERAGVPLLLFSLKSPPSTVVHSAFDEIVSPIVVSPWARPFRWGSHLVDHLRLASGSAGEYWRLLGRSVGRPLLRLLARPSAGRWIVLRKSTRRFSWAVWTARRAREAGVEHLHAHYAGEPMRVAHLVKKLAGISYSFTAHAKDLYLAPKGRLRRRLASAEFAVGCHEHGVERMRALLPTDDRGKVRYVRHGLDLGLFIPAEPGAPRDGRILAVGRLTPKKGFDDLVEACAVLSEHRTDLRCDLVGDGRGRSDLEALICRHELQQQVRIRGFVPQEQLPAWYRRASIVVLPSRVLADGNRDGVPNVLLEAMASGTAVVASDAAGVREWIEHGETGLLVRSDEPAALAKAIERLLNDPAEAEALGREAAARVGELGFESTNRELVESFRGLLDRRVDDALAAAAAAAWEGRGLARKARKVLGRKPKRLAEVEDGIGRAVRPGIEANAWRPDLERLAGRRLWDEAIKGARLNRLLPLLTDNRGDARVLDLGSGRGGLTVALQARGLDVAAVDLRFRNCAVTRLRAKRYGMASRAITAVAESLPFGDGRFDAVACLEVLEHVEDPRALLSELRRVVRADGRCVVTVINRWAHFDPHYHLWGINFLPRALANRYISWRRRTKKSYRDRQTLDEMHYYTYRSFVRLAAELGFNVSPATGGEGWWARLRRRLSLSTSLGFNTLTVILEPRLQASPAPAHTLARNRSSLPSKPPLPFAKPGR